MYPDGHVSGCRAHYCSFLPWGLKRGDDSIPAFWSTYLIEVRSTPQPYVTLREKFIDDASWKYFVGHLISPIWYPKKAAWAIISLSNTNHRSFPQAEATRARSDEKRGTRNGIQIIWCRVRYSRITSEPGWRRTYNTACHPHALFLQVSLNENDIIMTGHYHRGHSRYETRWILVVRMNHNDNIRVLRKGLSITSFLVCAISSIRCMNDGNYTQLSRYVRSAVLWSVVDEDYFINKFMRKFGVCLTQGLLCVVRRHYYNKFLLWIILLSLQVAQFLWYIKIPSLNLGYQINICLHSFIAII